MSDLPTFHITDRRATSFKELPNVFEMPFDALKTSVEVWMQKDIPGENFEDQLEYLHKHSNIQAAQDAVIAHLGLYIPDEYTFSINGSTVYRTLNNDFFKRLALYHPQGLFLPMNRFFLHTYKYKGARFSVHIETVHLSDFEEDESNLLDPLICAFSHQYVYFPSTGTFKLLPAGEYYTDNAGEFMDD